MKSTHILTVLAGIIPALQAHWVYPVVSINNGAPSQRWQYVRKLGPGPPPYASLEDPARGEPHRDIYSDEIRCGRGSFGSAKTTETLVVNAGDEVTFFTFYTARENNYTQTMYHPGAAQVYLSKAPDNNLEEYKGDGEWFKIRNFGASADGKTWDLIEKGSLSVTIPKTTPPGKYLLKVEYIAYHQPNWAKMYEFYLACAHVEIKGPGGGSPGPMVQFPGAYDMFDRTLWRPHSMGYWGMRPGDNYKNPGPEVWTG
ncbi:glycosyl hydrolase family 61-domain-containing protein [Dendryphion nanum]|uniref:lytic cellulose monooxygenase (C4-dehydrogenating) n=1 Tax=Dendryphion nanum TaxID=256645 RepID=A0A9P9J1X4_9PLEO|nr:glycosyl hydrolase family 61-domain-containing protein [Dendryphion nanum]